MCRLECDCQPSCATTSQKSRFIVTPVEEQPKNNFVRNKNVKFFAAESDDSDYEENQPESAGYGSSFYEENGKNDNISDDDSGFADESENETKFDSPESASSSTGEKSGTPIKSILRHPKKDTTVKGQGQTKKVHFANPVATYRLIPSRHEQLVEIDADMTYDFISNSSICDVDSNLDDE